MGYDNKIWLWVYVSNKMVNLFRTLPFYSTNDRLNTFPDHKTRVHRNYCHKWKSGKIFLILRYYVTYIVLLQSFLKRLSEVWLRRLVTLLRDKLRNRLLSRLSEVRDVCCVTARYRCVTLFSRLNLKCVTSVSLLRDSSCDIPFSRPTEVRDVCCVTCLLISSRMSW